MLIGCCAGGGQEQGGGGERQPQVPLQASCHLDRDHPEHPQQQQEGVKMNILGGGGGENI
jgi:hypothetical protein